MFVLFIVACRSLVLWILHACLRLCSCFRVTLPLRFVVCLFPFSYTSWMPTCTDTIRSTWPNQIGRQRPKHGRPSEGCQCRRLQEQKPKERTKNEKNKNNEKTHTRTHANTHSHLSFTSSSHTQTHTKCGDILTSYQKYMGWRYVHGLSSRNIGSVCSICYLLRRSPAQDF